MPALHLGWNIQGLSIGIERLSTELYEANVGRPFVGALVVKLEG